MNNLVPVKATNDVVAPCLLIEKIKILLAFAWLIKMYLPSGTKKGKDCSSDKIEKPQ